MNAVEEGFLRGVGLDELLRGSPPNLVLPRGAHPPEAETEVESHDLTVQAQALGGDFRGELAHVIRGNREVLERSIHINLGKENRDPRKSSLEIEDGARHLRMHRLLGRGVVAFRP